MKLLTLSFLLPALAVFSVFSSGCTEDVSTYQGPRCGFDGRAEYCKEACGADALCEGGDQPSCEAECRACDSQGNFCGEIPVASSAAGE